MFEYRSYKAGEAIKALMFSAFLILFLSVSLVTAFANTGPIILGTEMNTNGMVEYMCLGNGCENLTTFSWMD